MRSALGRPNYPPCQLGLAQTRSCSLAHQRTRAEAGQGGRLRPPCPATKLRPLTDDIRHAGEPPLERAHLPRHGTAKEVCRHAHASRDARTPRVQQAANLPRLASRHVSCSPGTAHRTSKNKQELWPIGQRCFVLEFALQGPCAYPEGATLQPSNLFYAAPAVSRGHPQASIRTATCRYGGREVAWCAAMSGPPPHHPTPVLRRKSRSALYNA